MPDNVKKELVGILWSGSKPEYQKKHWKTRYYACFITGDDAYQMMKEDHEMYAELIFNLKNNFSIIINHPTCYGR